MEGKDILICWIKVWQSFDKVPSIWLVIFQSIVVCYYFIFSVEYFFFLSDGRLHITTPIDPLFLLLPYLKKAKEVLLCFDFLFWNRYKTHNIIWQTSFLLCSSVFTSKGYRLWHLLCKKIKYWIYKWQQIVNRLKKARDEFNKYLFGNFFVIFCTSMLQSVY